MSIPKHSAQSWLIILVAALCLLTTVRPTIYRPGTPFGDFAHLFLGGQCLGGQCNPYDAAALNASAAARHQTTPQVWAQAPVYPPSSLLLALPLTPLGWPRAAIAFDLLSGLLFACAAVALVIRLRPGWPPALLLLTCLVSNPIVATLEFANPSLLAVALATLSALLLLALPPGVPSTKSLAWLALGLALALKPQLVIGVFLVLLCMAATRRSALQAAAFSLTLLFVAFLAYRLQLGSFAFLAQLQANLRMSLVPGSTSDFSTLNPESFDFLNLQTALSRLPHLTRAAVDCLAWAITAVLAACTLWLARRLMQPRRWTLLALAILISLMPLYHRGYDRVIALLLVPAAIELFAISRPLAWLYTAVACLWVANDTLMQHWLRRWHYAAQNPLEELILCTLLLVSLRLPARTPPAHAAVGSIAQ